ncbi:hypothetical protein [Bailinhaonella thermotolerans]|uniref:Uncharacterized protein n=1 Tax=Bailinhaonella thermotolerans TaxID=1070861 RepID=A0A3A4A315_9ACTN|nr:hypothetical protein [Bailinhaonella thermotolerans]RJL21100.1 hypothetical protein D5H75_38465 [Bailinhaonella thermotolerans]
MSIRLQYAWRVLTDFRVEPDFTPDERDALSEMGIAPTADGWRMTRHLSTDLGDPYRVEDLFRTLLSAPYGGRVTITGVTLTDLAAVRTGTHPAQAIPAGWLPPPAQIARHAREAGAPLSDVLEAMTASLRARLDPGQATPGGACDLRRTAAALMDELGIDAGGHRGRAPGSVRRPDRPTRGRGRVPRVRDPAGAVVIGHWWASGISVWHDGAGWRGRVQFNDEGWFVSPQPDLAAGSTEGTLRTRDAVGDGRDRSGLSAVLDLLRSDAERLGITWRNPAGQARPAGWRYLLNAQSVRLGWNAVYDDGATT